MSIGVIKCGGSPDILELFNNELEIYTHDLSKPLELTHIKNGKTSVFSDMYGGYFSPISELVKLVDGPIFVCADPSKKIIIESVMSQIREAIPCFDPMYIKPPSQVFLQEI